MYIFNSLFKKMKKWKMKLELESSSKRSYKIRTWLTQYIFSVF